MRTFGARGVEVVIENEPVLALAELGRLLVEHRQQAARHSSFHSSGAARSPHPSLILVIVEPREFDEVDELIAAIARTMQVVTVSSFEGGDNPGLRLLQRGRVESSSRQDQHPAPAASSRTPRRGLRLTEDDRPHPPAPPTQPAPWGDDLDDDAHAAADEQHEEAAEALISQAELAMLLGDDYGMGDSSHDEERAT